MNKDRGGTQIPELAKMNPMKAMNKKEKLAKKKVTMKATKARTSSDKRTKCSSWVAAFVEVGSVKGAGRRTRMERRGLYSVCFVCGRREATRLERAEESD